MPLWVSTYFAAYTAFCLWSHIDDFRNKRDLWWFAIAEAASNVFLILAALSFWVPSVRVVPAPVFFGLFVVGCAIFLGQAAVVCHKHIADPELSFQGKLFVGISGSVFGLITSVPLLFWGFKSTVVGIYAGT
jgi:hypothetical protein